MVSQFVWASSTLTWHPSGVFCHVEYPYCLSVAWEVTRLTVYRPLQVLLWQRASWVANRPKLCIINKSNRGISHEIKYIFSRWVFPTHFDIIACCMQKLSSIHRLSKKLERVQGFHGWGGKFENHKICWKLTSPGSKWRLKIQIRFADAKLALRGTTEVTRRTGLPLGE